VHHSTALTHGGEDAAPTRWLKRAGGRRPFFLHLGTARRTTRVQPDICTGTGLTPCHICTGTGLTLPTSAPGLSSPLPHLHRDWAHPAHICTGTGLAPCHIGRNARRSYCRARKTRRRRPSLSRTWRCARESLGGLPALPWPPRMATRNGVCNSGHLGGRRGGGYSRYTQGLGSSAESGSCSGGLCARSLVVSTGCVHVRACA
jgi:hypothetical protein